MKRPFRILWIVGVMGLLGGCASPNYMAENADVLLAYQQDASYVNLLALSEGYRNTLTENQKSGTTQPGLCADLGITLALLDYKAEASRMFNNEMRLYPSSQLYVSNLKSTLVPDYTEDTCTLLDLGLLDTLYAPLPRLQDSIKQALENPDIDMLIDEPRDAKAAAAERKAQQKQREAAKKAAEKEKAQQKKQQAAEKEALKQQKAAEREALKQQKAAEREALKQQKAAEREALKQQQAAARETEKQQRAAEKEAAKQQQETEQENQ